MLEPRLITTRMALAAVIARDALEREGSVSQLVSCEVISKPTGKIWPHNEHPGPLDGQPETAWWCEALYSDGSTRQWGPTTQRGPQ